MLMRDALKNEVQFLQHYLYWVAYMLPLYAIYSFKMVI